MKAFSVFSSGILRGVRGPKAALILILCLPSLNACSAVDKKNFPGCNEPSKQSKWLGRNFRQATIRMGVPAHEETFTMGNASITEFRGNLEVLFPRSNPENTPIQIKEAQWEKGNCNLTLWFRKTDNDWTVIDSLYWHKGAEF